MTPKAPSARPLRPVLRLGTVGLLAASAIVSATSACGWDPSRPFEREAPEVREAIGHLDGGDASLATKVLEDYLSTGACNEGSIGTPLRVRERPNGSFDLGLSLFKIAEAFGRRFGEEEPPGGTPAGRAPADPTASQDRAAQVTCALQVVRAVAEDAEQPLDLRARARYLEGNLLFLNGAYEDAVKAYDAALELAPGMGDGGPFGASAGRTYAPDAIGRDAAWNRAIALRRIEDKKDAGKDAEPDAKNDGGGDGGGGKNDDKKNDDKDGGSGADAGGQDSGKDAGGKDANADDDPNGKRDQRPNEPPPPSRQNQDERTLDQLENAPTVQQEAAKKQSRHKVRGMADK